MCVTCTECSNLVGAGCEECKDASVDVEGLVRCTLCADGSTMAADALSCVGENIKLLNHTTTLSLLFGSGVHIVGDRCYTHARTGLIGRAC